MPTYHRSQTTVFSATPSIVLQLLQDQPLKHLNIIGVEVEPNDDYKPESETAEWTGE
jgi:hypothetical protein